MSFALIAKLVWGSAVGRIVAISMLGFLAWKANNAYQRHVGATNAIAEINEQAETKSAEAVEARKPANRPGAVERLRKQSCGDC